MITINQIVREIESLPTKCYQDTLDFVGYLKLKQVKHVSETMMLSEKALAEYWDTPEEDEAWADL